ncbi:MAG: hypothetical protein ACFB2Z_10220 [Maricaulaceae bacterium]
MGLFASRLGLILALALSSHGAAAAQACRTVTLTDADAGAPIIGVEDMAYDPWSDEVYLSAFDRRAVADALAAGTEPPAGAVYAINARRLVTEGPAFKLAAVFDQTPNGEALRPHGIDVLVTNYGDRRLAIIHRGYDGRARQVRLMVYDTTPDAPVLITDLATSALCRANDVTIKDLRTVYVSLDHGGCADWIARLEDVTGFRGGAVARVDYADPAPALSLAVRGLGFPNGLAWSPADDGLWIAATRENALRFVPASALEDGRVVRAQGSIRLDGAPDNLARGDDDALTLAVHPDLLALARHRADAGVPTASRALGLTPAGQRPLVTIEPGAGFGGATVAIGVRGHIVLGAATQAGIAICETNTP